MECEYVRAKSSKRGQCGMNGSWNVITHKLRVQSRGEVSIQSAAHEMALHTH